MVVSSDTDYQVFEFSEFEQREILQSVRAVLQRHSEVLFAYAYGSFVDGAACRDLDIAIHLADASTTHKPFMLEDEIAQEVAETIQIRLPVDVRVTNNTPVALQFSAFSGVLLLDRDPDRRAAVLAWISAQYFDTKPFLEHYLKEAYDLAT